LSMKMASWGKYEVVKIREGGVAEEMRDLWRK